MEILNKVEVYEHKLRLESNMTAENFCYWLQGYIEISRANGQPIVITDKEVQVIEDHLKLIFKKEIPIRSGNIGQSCNLLSFIDHPVSC